MKRFIDICHFVLVLAGLMLCGLFLTSTLSYLPVHGVCQQWIIFSGQNILAFVMPALLTWKICFAKSCKADIGICRMPGSLMLAAAVVIYLAGIPFLNQIIYWNQEMHLPEALSSFEIWCRAMEKAAEEQTSSMLAGTSLTHLFINIGVIGILTGIGEEFFFRGALQSMLIRCKVGPHVAIWTSAVVFSILHFQFFGFVPRILLGAWFGYLYWWSGSIWLNSFAHALNNSLVILSAWLINKGIIGEEFDMLGVSTDAFPWAAVASAVIISLLIYFLNKRMRNTHVTSRLKSPESQS